MGCGFSRVQLWCRIVGGFGRERSLMERDPVCGMDVDESQVNDSSSHEGQRYYFCSPGCRSEFDRNPQRYTSGSIGVNPEGSGPQGQRFEQGGQQPREGAEASQRERPKHRKAS